MKCEILFSGINIKEFQSTSNYRLLNILPRFKGTDKFSGEAKLPKLFLYSSENGSSLKGMNLLLLRANSSQLQQTHCQKKIDVHENKQDPIVKN